MDPFSHNLDLFQYIVLQEELRILKESGGSVQKTKRIKTEVKTEPHKLLRNSEVIDLT